MQWYTRIEVLNRGELVGHCGSVVVCASIEVNSEKIQLSSQTVDVARRAR
jgi:hypothetical protein